MEIELQLDADGRTTCDPNTCTAVGSIEGDYNVQSINYSTQAFFLPTISSMSKHGIKASKNGGSLPSLYDALLRDCEVNIL